MPVVRTFRSRFLSIGVAVSGVILFIVGIATVLSRPSKASSVDLVGGAVAYVLLLAFMLLRMARARLCVLPEGVRVVNYLRNRFIPWDEIVGFSLRGWGIWWTPVGHVDLKDGSSVPVLGIGRSSQVFWRKIAPADDMIDELNRILNAVRTGDYP